VSRTRTYAVLAVAFFVAASLQAITYVVPTDRELVRRADAVVLATATESHSELTDRGSIVTITTLQVEDVLKGDIDPTALQITEPGGFLRDRALTIFGSPRFENGKQYLLFLRRTAQNVWTTYTLQVGVFEFTTNLQGLPLIPI